MLYLFCLLDYKKLLRNPPSLKLPTVKRFDCHEWFNESSLSNISLGVCHGLYRFIKPSVAAQDLSN